MIEATRAQLPKQAIGVIMAINMNSMLMKIIGREVYLLIKNPFGLSKDPRPKRCPMSQMVVPWGSVI